ncbi:MAG: rod shape-determining protein MreD [Gaiellales bacterium]|nr:rod shape-determining protein MreD [Gaiellales bacterium]
MTDGRRIAAGIARLVGLLVLAVALQAILTSRFTLLGVTADLFVILTVLVGLTRGSLIGGVLGFVAGLLADMVFLDPIGLHALIYLVTGYAIGRYAEWLPPLSAWAVVAAAAAATLGSQFAYAVFQLLTGGGASFFGMLWVQVLPSALVNGLVAAPLYLGLVRLRLIRRLDAVHAVR